MYRKVTLVILILMLVFAGVAYAGVWDSVKGWVSGELLALLATAGLAIFAAVNKVFYNKLVKTFGEIGEFLDKLSEALEDNKVSKEELSVLVKEFRDIFAVWK